MIYLTIRCNTKSDFSRGCAPSLLGIVRKICLFALHIILTIIWGAYSKIQICLKLFVKFNVFNRAKHGSYRYYTPSGKKVSGASIFFESLSYKVNHITGYIDYEKLEERAVEFHPRILICGGSSYPREWDFARLRQIAERCGAVLMCDMATISGLVAAKVWKLNLLLSVGLWHFF